MRLLYLSAGCRYAAKQMVAVVVERQALLGEIDTNTAHGFRQAERRGLQQFKTYSDGLVGRDGARRQRRAGEG